MDMSGCVLFQGDTLQYEKIRLEISSMVQEF
jgi:hypothetical protein